MNEGSSTKYKYALLFLLASMVGAFAARCRARIISVVRGGVVPAIFGSPGADLGSACPLS